MLVAEARWLGARLSALADDDLFPLLNVGSSTLEYRTVDQPHVQQLVFDPLAARGGAVWHTDLKPDDGVDLVGDLMDPAFVAQLAALGPRSVMVSNVLQHVTDPRPLGQALADLLPTGGLVIASGPRQYPHTTDPIDVGFRPAIADWATVFPGTELVDGTEIDAGRLWTWSDSERGRSLGRWFTRLLVPVPRPRTWLQVARQAPYLVRPAVATAVVLRKA